MLLGLIVPKVHDLSPYFVLPHWNETPHTFGDNFLLLLGIIENDLFNSIECIPFEPDVAIIAFV